MQIKFRPKINNNKNFENYKIENKLEIFNTFSK